MPRKHIANKILLIITEKISKLACRKENPTFHKNSKTVKQLSLFLPEGMKRQKLEILFLIFFSSSFPHNKCRMQV
jgi:hypothetical protein